MEKRELNYASMKVNEYRERYEIYKAEKAKGISYPVPKYIEMLGVLEKLGFPMDKPGTYLLSVLAEEAYNKFSAEDYDEAMQASHVVLTDLSRKRSFTSMDIANGLNIMSNDFEEYINDAINSIDKNNVDQKVANRIYGPYKRNKEYGVLAYQIAKYYEYEEKKENKNVIGRFTATTFTDEDIHFIVYDNNTIDSPTLNIKNITCMQLKPRFEFITDEYAYDTYKGLAKKDGYELIKEYDIEPELLTHMRQKRMVKYSQDMAMLYGFDPDKSFDRNGGYPFKRVVKKRQILEKERKGIFN